MAIILQEFNCHSCGRKESGKAKHHINVSSNIEKKVLLPICSLCAALKDSTHLETVNFIEEFYCCTCGTKALRNNEFHADVTVKNKCVFLTPICHKCYIELHKRNLINQPIKL